MGWIDLSSEIRTGFSQNRDDILAETRRAWKKIRDLMQRFLAKTQCKGLRFKIQDFKIELRELCEKCFRGFLCF